jgi:uracil-DNA glycosylase family 4
MKKIGKNFYLKLMRKNKGQLEKIKEKIKKCKRCQLWKLRKNVVFGEGPFNAKVMIVGMAPGVKEDELGKPFVGRAGKFLDQLLKKADLKRDKVFISSVLKCLPQPPINRKPKKEEIKACLPWLKKQIEIINPKYFILLGEIAFLTFFPKEKLKKFRGKWIKKDKKFYFPTYHPAAGLRFLKIKKILEQDFKKLKKTFL